MLQKVFEIISYYTRVVQLLHSCGPLFKIIRVCGPQPAKNTYFSPKLRVFYKKKKSLQLESISQNSYFRPKIRVFSEKKKKSSLGINLRNSYFCPKIIAFFKKKKLPLLVIDKTCAKLFRGAVVGPRCITL